MAQLHVTPEIFKSIPILIHIHPWAPNDHGGNGRKICGWIFGRGKLWVNCSRELQHGFPHLPWVPDFGPRSLGDGFCKTSVGWSHLGWSSRKNHTIMFCKNTQLIISTQRNLGQFLLAASSLFELKTTLRWYATSKSGVWEDVAIWDEDFSNDCCKIRDCWGVVLQDFVATPRSGA